MKDNPQCNATAHVLFVVHNKLLQDSFKTMTIYYLTIIMGQQSRQLKWVALAHGLSQGCSQNCWPGYGII